MKEKFLPIGTVVLLKGGIKRLMITGFCVMDGEKKDKIYDYCGTLYPEGFVSADKNALFNHSQIEKIYYMGYIDQEEKEFKYKMKKALETQNILENVQSENVVQKSSIQSQPIQQQPTVVQPQPNLNTLNLNQQNNNQ